MSDQPIRVLLVDDEQAARELVERLLGQLGNEQFLLQWAASYDEALEALALEPFDVGLIDYRLGGRDGLELIREAIARGCNFPLVLLTSYASEDVSIEAMRAGAAGFFEKATFGATQLVRGIRSAVEGQRLRDAQRWQSVLVDLGRISAAGLTAKAAADLDAVPSQRLAPEVFRELVNRYENLLDDALERRAYQTEKDSAGPLRLLSERLVSVGAGARDVIEIHYTATTNKSNGVAPEKAIAYVEEGNLLALELMGYLVSCYRDLSAEHHRTLHPTGQ